MNDSFIVFITAHRSFFREMDLYEEMDLQLMIRVERVSGSV